MKMVNLKGDKMIDLTDYYKVWDEYCEGPLMTAEEYDYYGQHKAEMEAENAWLKHAEMATYDDYGFEKYENDLKI